MAKRGRPKASEEKARREAVLQAAINELVEKGYENVTMLSIAKRASASKETLYNWFGNKLGLFSLIIERQGKKTVERLAEAFDTEENPHDILVNFAVAFLRLLLGEPSLSLNRAAMTSSELAEVLLQHGRHTVGPIVENYLDQLKAQGRLNHADSAEAFQLLYGLIIQDWQIRILLGERPPSQATLVNHAQAAVDRFMWLSS